VKQNESFMVEKKAPESELCLVLQWFRVGGAIQSRTGLAGFAILFDAFKINHLQHNRE